MKKNRRLDRREALKLLAAGSTLAGSTLCAKTDVLSAKGAALTHPASHKHARIVIAGGGTAGMIAAARVRRAAPNAEITLISPNARHLYQSGALFRAAGLMSEREMVRDTSSFFPDNVRWLQEKVTAFDPQKRIVESEKSGKIPYDVLIVALGCSYDYGAIEGMDAEQVGKEGVFSIYLNDTVKGTAEGAERSYAMFQKMLGDVMTASRPLEILFCEPDTPVKGKGSALSLMLLYHDLLKRKGGGQKVRFTYVIPSSQLLDEKAFDDALKKLLKKCHDIEILYGHSLQKLDSASKKVTLVSGTKVSKENMTTSISPRRCMPILWCAIRCWRLARVRKRGGWMSIPKHCATENMKISLVSEMSSRSIMPRAAVRRSIRGLSCRTTSPRR